MLITRAGFRFGFPFGTQTENQLPNYLGIRNKNQNRTKILGLPKIGKTEIKFVFDRFGKLKLHSSMDSTEDSTMKLLIRQRIARGIDGKLPRIVGEFDRGEVKKSG